MPDEPQSNQSPAEQLLTALDAMNLLAAALGGAAQQLKGQGFSDEQAHQIVADMFHQMAYKGQTQEEGN